MRRPFPAGEHELGAAEVHRAEHIYIVPRTSGPQAGTALIGATVEDIGFDKSTSPSALADLRRAAAELIPALGNETRAPMPEFHIEFYPFANVNNTIRMREGRVLVRISDMLEAAPEAVLHAIAHILIAKLYRKPIERAHETRYRRYVSSHDMAQKAHLLRQIRGRKSRAPHPPITATP